MSILVTHQAIAEVYTGTDKKQGLFVFNNVAKQTIETSGFTMESGNTFSIAASGSLDLPLGDVTDVRGLYLEVDADCTVQFSGSADTIPVKVPSGAVSGTKGRLLMDAQLTAVLVNNPSATAALTGRYCMWGDPSA